MSVVHGGRDDATEVTARAHRLVKRRDPVASVAVALALAGVLTARRARQEVDLADDEHVLFRGHPRRAALRYLMSLGLWELPRRTTEFIVTERRVILGRGLLVRRTRSIPLRQISAIDVVQTPWERVVQINGGVGGPASMQMGPLDARSARLLTAAVSAAIAARRR